MNNWNPSSWRDFPIKQQPTYNDLEKLKKVETELASYPPLIFAGEALNLKKQLADVKINASMADLAEIWD